MTRYRSRPTYGRPSVKFDYDLDLNDVLPVPAVSEVNAGSSAVHTFAGSIGTRFTNYVTDATLADSMATYALSPGPAALREAVTEDLQVKSRVSRTHRENFKREGGRVGSAYEYARFRSGATSDARFWERRTRKERPRVGTVTIHATQAMHAGEDAMSLEWTGAAAWAIADLLEELGYRVVIRSVSGNSGESTKDGQPARMDIAMTLKHEDERLSEHGLAILCHGGIARMVKFHNMLTTEVRIHGGFGMPEPYAGKLVADITIPHSVRSEDAARTFITETMKRYASSDLDEDERRADDRERMNQSTSAWGYRGDDA